MQRLSEQVTQRQDELLRFAQELIRTPSPSGEEGAIAQVVATKLQELGYDEVHTDEVGNVIGLIRGHGKGPSVMLTAHLDAADPGELSLWEHPPHEGHVQDGYLHGLGASDCKGAISAMAIAGAMLKEEGVSLGGDLLVAFVVMAERAEGFGIMTLFDRTLPSLGLKADLVVLGDPTGLDLYLGQRGRLELEVTTIGRTAHASAPWLGQNAVYKMMPVVEGLQELAANLPSHPFLEKSTLALTNLRCSPARFSIIPDRCIASIDRRYLPTESLDTIIAQVQAVLNRVGAKDPEFKGEARVRTVVETAYTGQSREVAKLLTPFLTSEGHPVVGRVKGALEALGQDPTFDKWYFSTEGGYTSGVLGIPTLGYAPGEEKYSHTPFDRVSLEGLKQAAAGYAAIARAIAGQEETR